MYTLTVNGQRTGISSRCKVQAGGRCHSQFPYDLDLYLNNKLFIDTDGERAPMVAFNYNHLSGFMFSAAFALSDIYLVYLFNFQMFKVNKVRCFSLKILASIYLLDSFT